MISIRTGGYCAAALVVLAACIAFGSPARAQWRDWAQDFDEDKKPWKEIEAKIPPYPTSESLLPFEASAASPHRFFLDAKSLSIGEDGVVRYTLVVKTAGGATNVSFEGMRCDTREQKYYAVGRADGTWARARKPEWRRVIQYQDTHLHHSVLIQDFLCEGVSRKSPARSEKDVLRLLKFGPPARSTE